MLALTPLGFTRRGIGACLQSLRLALCKALFNNERGLGTPLRTGILKPLNIEALCWLRFFWSPCSVTLKTPLKTKTLYSLEILPRWVQPPCFTFFLRKGLSNEITKLSKPEEIAKLPKFLQGLGKALGADADDPIQKEKNHLLSYIPAQIVSLTASALIGPAIGSQAMQHLKQVHQWAQSPDKVQHLKEGVG